MKKIKFLRILFAIVYIILASLIQVESMIRYDYATISFSYLTSIVKFSISSDEKTYIIQGESSQFLIYKATQNIFDFKQIIYQSSTPVSTLGITPDASKILTYSLNQRLIRVYGLNLADYTYSIFQQMIPFTPSALSANYLSYNGLRWNSNTASYIVSYLYDGVTYNMDSNTSYSNTCSVKTLSPDGNYFFCGQYSNAPGTIYFRIYQHTLGGLTQVYFNAFMGAATTNSATYKILVSQAVAGVYDVIFFERIDSVLSCFYVQFNSGSNSVTTIQTILSNVPSTSFGYNAYVNSYLTRNGKYFSLADTNIKETRIYEKIASQYVQIYYYLNTSVTPSLDYFSQNSSFFISKSSSSVNSMLFFFTCNVANCAKCYWINKCSICNSGYQAINDICQCSDGYSDISGVCTLCSIANCVSCSGVNICSSCGNGYTLIGNICTCNSPKNISTISAKCVSCNVQDCYKCSYDDNCDVFKSSISSGAINSLNNSTDQQTKMVIGLIVIIVTLAGVIGFVVYKLIKISSAVSKFFPSEQTQPLNNKAQQNQQKRITQEISISELNHKNQSHQTLNGKQQQVDIDSKIDIKNPSFSYEKENIQTHLVNSNDGVQAKKRKRRANINMNDERVQFNQDANSFQEITIVNVNSPFVKQLQ